MTRDATKIAPPVVRPEYEVIFNTSLAEFNIKLNDMVLDGWMVDGDTSIEYIADGLGSTPCFAQRMKRIKQ